MTDRVPASDMLPEEREERTIASESVARPASAGTATGGLAIMRGPDDGCRARARARLRARRRAGGAQPVGVRPHALLPSQARRHEPHHPHRLRPRRAFSRAPIAPHTEDWQPAYDANYLNALNQAPSLDFPFGTDQLGRDYLSRVIYGVQTSLGVAIVVALLATLIGTIIGAVAGYYGGAIDNGLMRFTDLILTVPGLAIAARRRRVSRQLGRQCAARRHVVRHSAADGDRPHPRLPLLDRHRAHRARVVPLVTREGVRRGGEGSRRRRPPHHRAAHPPQLRRVRSSSTRR